MGGWLGGRDGGRDKKLAREAGVEPRWCRGGAAGEERGGVEVSLAEGGIDYISRVIYLPS
jgi:hypothetical protein